MPRPSTDTRGLLLRTGQHLFAQDGVFAVSLTTILQQAGQRNTSALHYHFGGRQGLLDAIIERHDESIEAERRDFLADLEQRGLDKDLRSLVAALVVPFSRKLLDTDGREFLRIIAQLSHLFDAWDHPGSPEQARRVFLAIEDGLVLLPPEVRHLRVTTFLDLVTHALAARARLLDGPPAPLVDHEAFVANLIEMSVGALAASGQNFEPGSTGS